MWLLSNMSIVISGLAAASENKKRCKCKNITKVWYLLVSTTKLERMKHFAILIIAILSLVRIGHSCIVDCPQNDVEYHVSPGDYPYSKINGIATPQRKGLCLDQKDPSLPPGQVGVLYSEFVKVGDGCSLYCISMIDSASKIPDGITLHKMSDKVSLTGFPRKSGNYVLKFTAKPCGDSITAGEFQVILFIKEAN